MLAQLQSSIVTPDLVKASYITFTKFDPVRFKGKTDEDGYVWVNNWVFIGSLGDPETWDGDIAIKAKTKGDKDGLAGTLIDMNTM